jgi:hypothetical protein
MLRLFRSAAYDRQSINSLHGISIKRFWGLSIRLAQHCYHAGETADAESVIEISKAVLRQKKSSSPTSSPVDVPEVDLHERSHTQSD